MEPAAGGGSAGGGTWQAMVDGGRLMIGAALPLKHLVAR